MSIYEIEVPTIDGGSTTLEEFRGQLLLIVKRMWTRTPV